MSSKGVLLVSNKVLKMQCVLTLSINCTTLITNIVVQTERLTVQKSSRIHT